MRRGIGAVAVIAGVLAIAGCGATTPTLSPSAGTAGSIVVDDTLIALLPAEVGGVALTADAATAAEIAGAGDLAADIEAIALALYVQAGSSTAEDLAIVNVVRLRPGVFSEGWYRTWRTTYDEAACEIAGGLAPGGAESRIGEHETQIGTCEGGVHTYHVHLSTPERVISITSVGEGRYGERVIEGLTE